MPFHYIAPFIIVIVIVGAWQETRHWADLAFLLGFGLLGWLMRRSGMPRPPLLIGFILSGLAERCLWMSYNLYDWEWLTRPGVLIIGTLAIALILGSVKLKRNTARQAEVLQSARAPAAGLFVLSFLKLQFRSPWLPSLGLAAGIVILLWGLGNVLHLRWPAPWLGL